MYINALWDFVPFLYPRKHQKIFGFLKFSGGIEMVYNTENNWNKGKHWYEMGLDLNKNSTTQPAFTCSKLTIETQEEDVKYVKS